MGRGGDLSVQLQRFLRSGVINPNGKMSAILKCIQQEIICPPVMDLRLDIYKTLPYKDVAGSWYVRIELYFEEEKKEETIQYSKSPSDPSPLRTRSAGATNDNIKRGVFVHTPRKTRAGSQKRNLMLSTSHMSDEKDIREELEYSKSPSPTVHRIANARRLFKRTSSLPAFEGSLPTKAIRENLTKSRLVTTPPKAAKDSNGRKKLTSSTMDIRKSKKQ